MSEAGSGDTIWQFRLDRLTGGALPLDEFRGHPLLIVNTASKCGFTPQYAGLEAVWKKYREAGLIVLGVPSNDFGGQEPGGSAEIASFCQINYGVDFPMAAKVKVSGAGAHPLFTWFGRQGGFLARPRWNFYKYLIDRDGRFAGWFSSLTSPGSTKFERALAAVVGGPRG
jgi:glutathione peroxidase